MDKVAVRIAEMEDQVNKVETAYEGINKLYSQAMDSNKEKDKELIKFRD